MVSCGPRIFRRTQCGRVMEFLPAPLDRAESDAMADRCQSLIAERLGLLGRRNKGKPGVHRVCRLARSWFRASVLSLCRSRLAPCLQHWGKGFATEAARGALRVGFELLCLPEIVSFTAVCNKRSRAVMERLHMREVGPFEHPSLPVGSRLRRHCLFRLSREQWVTASRI